MVKHNVDGTVNRYKAQPVAKGNVQTHGVNYEENFYWVAKMTTIQTVIALASTKGWHLHQMDVKNTFLQASYRREGVHGITTRIQVEHTSKCCLSQDASLRSQVGT